MKTALEILNQVEPNGELLDTDQAVRAMELYARSNAIDFAKWLQHFDDGTTHYNPFTKEVTESIGFSPFVCLSDGTYTIEELYERQAAILANTLLGTVR